MSEHDDLLDPGVKGDNPQYAHQDKVPNSSGILVLGILSIATCWLYAIPGLACGVIALILHRKAKEVYLTDPIKYDQSYKNAKAGMICAIIGTCLSGLFLIYVIFVIAMMGAMLGSMPVR